MKDTENWFTYFPLLAGAMTVMTLVGACAVSSGSGSTYAIEIPGPNGVKCYAITDGTQVFGGNCK